MVKIPSIDDLKKMGSNLIDSAKSVNLDEMVEKVKSSIDSISNRKSPVEDVTNETLKNSFQGIMATLTEMTAAQNTQVNAIKKLEKQLEELARQIESFQNPPSEEKKSHE